MIERFTEYAANERTFLAWVRTALSIGAFGFIVDKYGILAQTNGNASSVLSKTLIGHAGNGLMLLCVVVLLGATVRFIIMTKRIASTETVRWRFILTDVLLGLSLAAVGAAVVLLTLHVGTD